MEVAREYHRRGIPVDAIVIDSLHWTERGNCDFDPEYWPDPKAMIGFHDGLKSEGEEEIVLLTRAAYPGSQKFGALVWNGDIISSFNALKESVISGLSMAMCGIPA